MRRDERRTVPRGNVSGGRNLGAAVSLDSTTCAEVPGESRRGTQKCFSAPQRGNNGNECKGLILYIRGCVRHGLCSGYGLWGTDQWEFAPLPASAKTWENSWRAMRSRRIEWV